MRRSSGVVVLLALILNAFASGRVQASREAAPLGERRRGTVISVISDRTFCVRRCRWLIVSSYRVTSGTAEPLPLFQTSRSGKLNSL